MEHLRADVVVIGTGGAGMAAALTAAEGGARVVLFEKRPFSGGASNTIAVLGVVRNDQAMRDKAFQIHMDMTRWTGNPGLVRAWINKTGELVEWLTKLGVEFLGQPILTSLENMGTTRGFGGGFPNGYSIFDVHPVKPRGSGHGGSAMIGTLMARAKEKGIDVRLGAPVRKILKESGRISGVIAEDKSGNTIQVDARAVVVATAGFNEDEEMIKKYGGFEFTLDREGNGEKGDLFFLHPNLKLTGDGIRMAWEVGADKGAMGIGLLNNVPGPGIIGHMPWIMLNQLRVIQEQPYLWVNQQGERFIDESLANDHMTMCHAIIRQKAKCGYIVFDARTKRYMEEVGLDYMYFIFQAKRLEDVDGQFTKCIAQGNKHVFMAESLAELATQMGISPDVLQKTVDTYNQYCDKGHDDLFAKEPKFLHAVREPKFYALRNIASAYDTIGGIRVNRRLEVLNKGREVISGLYAAGDVVVAEIFGDPPTLGTGSIGFALASGRIAGESAVEYLAK
jgi:fumarate reductase flavoprotein subunit